MSKAYVLVEIERHADTNIVGVFDEIYKASNYMDSLELKYPEKYCSARPDHWFDIREFEINLPNDRWER
jgi:hypothetical protein